MRQFEDFWTDKAGVAAAHLSCPCCSGKNFGTISAVAQLGTSSTDLLSASFAAAEAATVPGDILVDGTVEPDEVDYYSITLTAGQIYLFSAYGSGDTPLPDTYLYLFDNTGALIASDDDGGSGTNSLLTYTAAYSGTFYVGVGAFPGFGLTGDYTLDIVADPGADVVPETFSGAAPLTIGEVTYGFIDEGSGAYGPDFSEVDTYRFTAEAGTVVTLEIAGGADSNSNPAALPPGEIDTYVVVYDAAGNPIASNDDIRYPSDVSSRVSFVVPESGTYYLDVFGYAPGTGGYSITSSVVNLAELDPLDTITWFSAENVPFDENDTAYVYFAPAGETFGEEGPSFGWNPYEIQQVMKALEEYEKILGTHYEITTDADQATFRIFTTTSDEFGAYFYPQDPGYGDAQGVGAFNVDSGGWSFDQQQSLEQGGYSFAVILHEFGHAHGLAHPHDTGGGSEIMPGVVGAVGSYGVFDLNQGVYTVMSYNDAWDFHPDGPTPFTAANIDSGWSGTLSAFDIAALQRRYGIINEYATGNDVYVLHDANDPGTYYETIWDTGGTDTIQYNGARNAQIDLLAATLDYSPTGGGAISFVDEIWGGYTIANGVVIENATGGSGDDVLLGNAADNVLRGNGGNDVLIGREGDDTLYGGMGDNTFTGGAGADTFIIDGAFINGGRVTITDFEEDDQLLLVSLGNARIRFEQVGDDTLIYANGGLVATVEDTEAAEALAGAEFQFKPKSVSLIVDGELLEYNLNGTARSETLNGKGGVRNLIDGRGGDDFISGRNEDDILIGKAGNDILEGRGGNDQLFGGTGDDQLFGDNGDDTLFGGGGNDLLVGGKGSDILTGGAGFDTFRFDPSDRNSGVDRVTDYDVQRDSIAFEGPSRFVTFADGADGAEMFFRGKLMAVFEGVSASDMAGELSTSPFAGMVPADMYAMYAPDNFV